LGKRDCAVRCFKNKIKGATGDERPPDEEAYTVDIRSRMKPFDFLLGQWALKYRVPKSALSEATTGSGEGAFRRALNGTSVFFDYSCTLRSAPGQKTTAHGIFIWDGKTGLHRYRWFESTGAFMTAACRFVGKDALLMHWEDSSLVQTFKKTGPAEVLLRMENQNPDGESELVMEVVMSKKKDHKRRIG